MHRVATAALALSLAATSSLAQPSARGDASPPGGRERSRQVEQGFGGRSDGRTVQGDATPQAGDQGRGGRRTSRPAQPSAQPEVAPPRGLNGPPPRSVGEIRRRVEGSQQPERRPDRPQRGDGVVVQPPQQRELRRGGAVQRPQEQRDGRRDAEGWRRDGGQGGWDRDGRGPRERPDWARPDTRRDRDRNRPRYDQRRYQREWWPRQQFRAPFYSAPFGYYQRQWGFDDYLPWGWYGPSYWIDDWYNYGLPLPPAGYEWVRVGRDALLVDIFDGRVRAVAHMLFW